MKAGNIIALLISVIAIFLLSYILSGAPDNTSLLDKLNPIDAFQGLAFALAWGYVGHPMVAYLLTLLIFALVFVGIFFFTRILIDKILR
ncbi:hypothetical protein CYG68_20015 [Morganella morganii]|uniref:Uncharacterized protein n=1 Tax=Morganella morganii TaxID=582 RepID=A0A8I0U602_MORMO|nr:hypothetical protein [Morganella morganii]MBE8614635.1 hypothetical protein [Morganella morganii]